MAPVGKCMLGKHAGPSLATQHLHQDVVHTCNPSDWGWSQEDPWDFLTPPSSLRDPGSKHKVEKWLRKALDVDL